jgi:hypothetical protein
MRACSGRHIPHLRYIAPPMLRSQLTVRWQRIGQMCGEVVSGLHEGTWLGHVLSPLSPSLLSTIGTGKPPAFRKGSRTVWEAVHTINLRLNVLIWSATQ